jgi:hypothetical protein
MDSESVTLRLVGTKRLLMHSGRLADPLDEASKALGRLTSKRILRARNGMDRFGWTEEGHAFRQRR